MWHAVQCASATSTIDGGMRTTVEGWAHLMDRERCLAVAVAGFGVESEDSLFFSAEGHVHIERQWQQKEKEAEGVPRGLLRKLHLGQLCTYTETHCTYIVYKVST